MPRSTDTERKILISRVFFERARETASRVGSQKGLPG